MDTRCSACNGPMACNPGNCWCEKLSSLPTIEASKGCLCPGCLGERLAKLDRKTKALSSFKIDSAIDLRTGT